MRNVLTSLVVPRRGRAVLAVVVVERVRRHAVRRVRVHRRQLGERRRRVKPSTERSQRRGRPQGRSQGAVTRVKNTAREDFPPASQRRGSVTTVRSATAERAAAATRRPAPQKRGSITTARSAAAKRPAAATRRPALQRRGSVTTVHSAGAERRRTTLRGAFPSAQARSWSSSCSSGCAYHARGRGETKGRRGGCGVYRRRGRRRRGNGRSDDRRAGAVPRSIVGAAATRDTGRRRASSCVGVVISCRRAPRAPRTARGRRFAPPPAVVLARQGMSCSVAPSLTTS